MEIVSYGGWQRCARFVHEGTELIVTLEVGPRIIRYGLVGGVNEFVEHPEEMGKSGDEHYRSYGGHRLWIAPEIEDITLQPDNHDVTYREEDGHHIFTTALDRWHVQKELRIELVKGGVAIHHRLYNHSAHDLELATWALTQLSPGGTAYFPMPAFKPHHEEVLPSRPMALWGYTNLADPRWGWSQTLASLKQDPTMGPQKLGMFVQQGFAAYANHGNLFVKTFGGSSDYDYPDYGCNFETFTNEKILELESLGIVTSVEKGDFASHTEHWALHPKVELPVSLQAVYGVLEGFAEVLGIPEAW